MTVVITSIDRLLRTVGATIVGVVGLLALVAAIWMVEELRKGVGVDVVAVTLAVCYATYVGVALTCGNLREIQVENAFLGLGLVFVGLGLWHRIEWLAFGWVFYGGWDLLHCRERHLLGVEGVLSWYVVTCLVWDFIVAVGILFVLQKRGASLGSFRSFGWVASVRLVNLSARSTSVFIEEVAAGGLALLGIL